MKTIASLLEELGRVKREVKVNQLEGEDLLLYLEKEGGILCRIEETLDRILQEQTS